MLVVAPRSANSEYGGSRALARRSALFPCSLRTRSRGPAAAGEPTDLGLESEDALGTAIKGVLLSLDMNFLGDEPQRSLARLRPPHATTHITTLTVVCQLSNTIRTNGENGVFAFQAAAAPPIITTTTTTTTHFPDTK